MVDVVIYTDDGMALRLKGAELTLFGSNDSKAPLPRLEEVKMVVVKTDVALLDTGDASYVLN